MNEELISTIDSAIKEGSAHLERLRDSDGYLQDSMARRLLPSLYALLEADTEPRAFLDILGRLEKLNVITSVETWRDLETLFSRACDAFREAS